VLEQERLLVVEDDLALASLMAAYLEKAGFQVSCAASGREMLAALAADTVDLVLLDLELPDEDGFVLVRKVRHTSGVPIVIVTARADVEHRVAGLEMGADDYVIKPFDARELAARVRNILNRAGRQPRVAEGVVSDGLTLRPADHMVVDRDGAAIHLTPSEASILGALIRARGRPLSRDQLLDANDNLEGPESVRSVDVAISRLRRKIERDPHAPSLLLTVPGLGYRLNLT
jgi:DNA-binding response OmpR family regulator